MTSEGAAPRRGRVRWAIALMLGVGVLINYFDRVNPNRVRKAVLIGGMVVGLCVLFAATTDNPVGAVTWISLGLGGLSASAPVGSSCVALIAPEGSVGGVGGILNFTNQVFSSAAPIVTGFLVAATGSFAPGFVAAGIMIAIGIVCYLVLLGNIEQLPANSARREAVAGG